MSRSCAVPNTAMLPRIAKRFGIWPLVFVMASAFMGCGKSPHRVVVSGNVTYNGKPIEMGRIRFFPDAATQAPMTGAEIIDGRYLVDAKGGVMIGSYRVEITGFERSPASVSSDAAPIAVAAAAAAKKQFVPDRFNTHSELTLSVPSGSSSITQDYLLTDERQK